MKKQTRFEKGCSVNVSNDFRLPSGVWTHTWAGKVLKIFGDEILVNHTPPGCDEDIVTCFCAGGTLDGVCVPDNFAVNKQATWWCQPLGVEDVNDIGPVKSRERIPESESPPESSGGYLFIQCDGAVMRSIWYEYSKHDKSINDNPMKAYPENIVYDHDCFD